MGTYSKAISALSDRIKAHTKTGKVLDGFHFTPLPVETEEGDTDLPHIRLFIPSLSEATKGGFLSQGTLSAMVTVSTSKRDGVVKFVEAVEKVLDAIETEPVTMQPDRQLGGACQYPFSADCKDNFATELSLNAQITITLATVPFERGKRRNNGDQ